LKLLDSQGRFLYETDATVTLLDLSGYVPGLYVLQLWDAGRLIAISKIQKF
jgi:hypothetical protein